MKTAVTTIALTTAFAAGAHAQMLSGTITFDGGLTVDTGDLLTAASVSEFATASRRSSQRRFRRRRNHRRCICRFFTRLGLRRRQLPILANRRLHLRPRRIKLRPHRWGYGRFHLCRRDRHRLRKRVYPYSCDIHFHHPDPRRRRKLYLLRINHSDPSPRAGHFRPPHREPHRARSTSPPLVIVQLAPDIFDVRIHEERPVHLHYGK